MPHFLDFFFEKCIIIYTRQQIRTEPRECLVDTKIRRNLKHLETVNLQNYLIDTKNKNGSSWEVWILLNYINLLTHPSLCNLGSDFTYGQQTQFYKFIATCIGNDFLSETTKHLGLFSIFCSITVQTNNVPFGYKMEINPYFVTKYS